MLREFLCCGKIVPQLLLMMVSSWMLVSSLRSFCWVFLRTSMSLLSHSVLLRTLYKNKRTGYLRMRSNVALQLEYYVGCQLRIIWDTSTAVDEWTRGTAWHCMHGIATSQYNTLLCRPFYWWASGEEGTGLLRKVWGQLLLHQLRTQACGKVDCCD